MPNFPPRVQQTIDRGYEFNFGNYISEGINIVIKNALLFVVFAFVTVLIAFFVNIIPFLGILVFYLVLAPCLNAGFLIASRRANEGRALEFSDFFKGFDHIGQLVVAALIGYVPILLFSILALTVIGMQEFGMYSGSMPNLSPPLWLLLIYVPLIYLYISWSMSTYLIVFYKMKAWPALEASRQIVGKKWFHFFLLAVVTGIIATLGILILLVGILLTMPMVFTTQYAAFRDIAGVAEDTPLDLDITAHLVD